MRRRFLTLLGALGGLLLLASLVYPQTPANVQIAINQLVTGVTPFTALRNVASAYMNWGTTGGVNGYGFRDNAGVIEVKNSGGSWIQIPTSSTLPTNAPFWTRTPDGNLSNETALSNLATALIINTTGTGVPVAYAGTTCTNQFVRALSIAGAATCASIDLALDTTGALGVSRGGTGLTVGTSGGILAFTATGTLASSAALAANQLVVGGGAGVVPATLGSLGTTTTLLHGNAAGAPTFGAVVLTTDVSGILPSANGGTANAFFTVSGPATSTKTYTFPNASTTVLTTNAAVTAAQGGTGQTSYTTGDLLQATAATTLSKLAAIATGNALISGGVATASTWGKIGLTTHITGTLPVANGGTNLTTYTVGDLIYASATTTLARLAASTSGLVLTSNGAGVAPSWGPSIVFQTTTVTLTDAQVKALPTTPVTLLAAPGANIRYKVIAVSVDANCSAGAYTNINATYSSFQVEWASGTWAATAIFNDSTTMPATAGLTNLLGAASHRVTDLAIPYTDVQYWLVSGVSTVTDMANQLLRVNIDNNGSGVLTGGNAANVVKITLYYTTEAVP